MKREELLIEPDELATLLDDPALRLFDTTVVFDTSRGTGRDRYDRGHIPGAAFLDHASLSVKAPGLMYTLPDEDTLARLMAVLSQVLPVANPPTLTTQRNGCGGGAAKALTAYCPASNAIYVDFPALQAAGEPKTEDEDEVLVQGDNTALSMVTSRYALAVQRERGVNLDTPVAALRTACLTGVAQGRMTDENGADFVLSPGDVDEAVAGLLTNAVAASDVNGRPAPAGFTRILAYRLGLSSEADDCFERFS